MYFSSGLCFIVTRNFSDFFEKCVLKRFPCVIFHLSSNKFRLCKILKLLLNIHSSRAWISLSIYVVLIGFSLNPTDEFLPKILSSWFFINAKVDQILTIKFNFVLNIEWILFDACCRRSYDVSLPTKALLIINESNLTAILAGDSLVQRLVRICQTFERNARKLKWKLYSSIDKTMFYPTIPKRKIPEV